MCIRDRSITTPFHFLTVSGLAERPSNPVGGLTYINGEFDKGFRLMKELGVDYFIAYTASIKDKANMNENFNFLFSNEVFNVYSINTKKVELVEDNLYLFESPIFYDRLMNAVLSEGSEQSFFEVAYESFKDELNYKIIEKLSFMLNISDLKLNKDGKLLNNTFMFTGKLSNMSRAEAKSLIEENSGSVVSSVNKKLKYLIIGEKPTTRKVQQAKESGVKILSQKEWLNLLN